jgi:hypothetical protein
MGALGEVQRLHEYGATQSSFDVTWLNNTKKFLYVGSLFVFHTISSRFWHALGADL